MSRMTFILAMIILLASCGGAKKASAVEETPAEKMAEVPAFSSDSAMSYLRTQVEFGPRVPGSDSHRRAADWLVARLRAFGADVTEQRADLRAFDGTMLPARNIFARFHSEREKRLLLLAHYDTRPWADEDADAANHKKPIDGANDGASGVAVLLEAARHLRDADPEIGVDILLVDAEDYGTEGDDGSWALGARYFAEHLPVEGYAPQGAILLDMVGGRDATFPQEYFSMQSAPALDAAFRNAAEAEGFGDMLPRRLGGAVTDDHVQLIEQGIPAIDIIDYRPDTGFCPTWHTMQDTYDNIDPATIDAVGRSLLRFLFSSPLQ